MTQRSIYTHRGGLSVLLHMCRSPLPHVLPHVFPCAVHSLPLHNSELLLNSFYKGDRLFSRLSGIARRCPCAPISRAALAWGCSARQQSWSRRPWWRARPRARLSCKAGTRTRSRPAADSRRVQSGWPAADRPSAWAAAAAARAACDCSARQRGRGPRRGRRRLGAARGRSPRLSLGGHSGRCARRRGAVGGGRRLGLLAAGESGELAASMISGEGSSSNL